MTDQLAPTSPHPDALFHRQQGIYNPVEHPNDKAVFVGVGGIGSFAAFATAKLGVPNLTIIDPDVINVHNAPNQLHALAATGRTKVEALASLIEAHMGSHVTVNQFNTKHDGVDYDQFQGVVVSGLDSMEARKALWEERIKNNITIPLYIDARIAGQLILIYACCPYLPDEIEHYEKTLHSDADAEPAPCTERGVIDVGFQCGALITRMLRKHFAGEEVHHITNMSMNSLMLLKGDWIK